MNFFSFPQMEFAVGLSYAGVFPTGFVLGMELLGTKRRVYGGTIVGVCAVLGDIFSALLSMQIHHFRTLLLVYHIPGLLFISFYWFFPESVRWLLAVGKYDKAEKLLKKMAKSNKKELSEKSLEMICKEPIVEKEAEPESTTHVGLSDIFKSCFFVSRFAVAAYIWLATSYVLYGMSMMSTQIGGDKYLNYILIGLAQVSGTIASTLLVNKFGRRPL